MNTISSDIRQKHTATARAGFLLLFIYLFVSFSRTIETLMPTVHLTAVLYGLTLIFAVITGGVKRAFSNRIGAMLLAFCTWLVIAVPFSMWRGGSLNTLDAAARAIPVFLLIAGLTLDFIDCRKAIYAIAFGTLALAIYSFFVGQLTGGRLEMSYGKYANPNDLAQVLLMALPFWWLAASNPSFDKVRRLGAAAAGVLALVVMARTGSRAAMLATGVTLVVFFFKASNRARLVLAAGGVLGVVIAAGTLPQNLRMRYFTFFEANPAQVTDAEMEQRAGEATGSAYARAHLLEASLNLTINYPIFGVGPGMFQVGEDALARSVGERASWHESHNSYTQVSSEAGLPAFFFYVSVLALSMRACYRVYAKYRRRPECWLLANTAFAVLLSLISYAVSTLFVSAAYDVYLPCLAGIAVCLNRAAAAEEQGQRPAEPAIPAAPAVRPQLARRTPRQRRLVSP